jgi:hypothetical protein
MGVLDQRIAPDPVTKLTNVQLAQRFQEETNQ